MTASVTDNSIEMAGAGGSRSRAALRAPPAMARAPRRPWKRNAAMALLCPPDSHSRRQSLVGFASVVGHHGPASSRFF